MTEVLIIKTSSLGDVIHHMPALTEAQRHRPDARFSWLVEAEYVPLVARHPAVARIIPVATRRWRHSIFSSASWREARAFVAALRDCRYDAVIDSQGLIRSAVMTRLARAHRHGFDRRSVREPLASFLYDHCHWVAPDSHAITRNRVLSGLALGYVPEGPPDFGLDRTAFAAPAKPPRAVLQHGTARPEKQWPLEHWRGLAEMLTARGYRIVLPSGTAAEYDRSRQLAAALDCAEILDRVPLETAAATIAGASLVVGVDTGLLHLAAAFSIPLVGIFVGASQAALTGPMGAGPIAVVDTGSVPSLSEVQAAVDQVINK